MEFIKGRSMPTSTTTRVPTVHLGTVRSAVPLTGTHPQQPQTDEVSPFVQMVNKLYDYCNGNNQKKQEILKILQALINNQISVSEFVSRVGECIQVDLLPAFKTFLNKNLNQFRYELYKKKIMIPGLNPTQIPIAPRLPSTKAMATSHTTPKVAAPHSVPVPPAERMENAITTVETPTPAPPIKPKNFRQLPKCFTKLKPTKASKSDINETQKDSGCLSEGVDRLFDVTIMGGIKLEEEAVIGTEHIGTQERSIKEKPFLNLPNLLARCKRKCNNVVFPTEAMVMISQATEEYLKGIVDTLAAYVDLRMHDESKFAEYNKQCDLPAQLQFLEDLERVQARKRKDLQREEFLRIANSRSKTLNSQNAKIRARVKEMHAAETAALRHREANSTALEAIAPRKKFNFAATRPDIKASRSCVKRAKLQDAIALLEKDTLYKRSTFLALLYLK